MSQRKKKPVKVAKTMPAPSLEHDGDYILCPCDLHKHLHVVVHFLGSTDVGKRGTIVFRGTEEEALAFVKEREK